MTEETIFSKNLEKPAREIVEQDFGDVTFHGDGMYYTDDEWKKEKRLAETLKY